MYLYGSLLYYLQIAQKPTLPNWVCPGQCYFEILINSYYFSIKCVTVLSIKVKNEFLEMSEEKKVMNQPLLQPTMG